MGLRCIKDLRANKQQRELGEDLVWALNKRKKKGNGKEKAAKKAQKRHTEMCNRAMQMMDRIGRFLDKYESETSESE